MSAKKTIYRAWCPDDRSEKCDGIAVAALAPQEVAILWAKFNDRNGTKYSIANGEPAFVHVAEDFDGAKEHRFIVRVLELAPVYCAAPVAAAKAKS